jgi:manganese efflux pump family protein
VAEVALIALAVGLSNFAAAIGIGLSGVDGSLRLRIAFIFGFFEAAMPLVGLLIGSRLAHSVGSAASYLGGGLLIAAGIYTVVQARRDTSDGLPGTPGTGNLIVTGAALSIDNLIVGFALGTHEVSVALAAIVIAVVSVGLSIAGLELGSRLGTSVEKWSAELGGAVLVLIGIAAASGVL